MFSILVSKHCDMHTHVYTEVEVVGEEKEEKEEKDKKEVDPAVSAPHVRLDLKGKRAIRLLPGGKSQETLLKEGPTGFAEYQFQGEGKVVSEVPNLLVSAAAPSAQPAKKKKQGQEQGEG